MIKMKKITLDSFGINIEDLSVGWKSLYWTIPYYIKRFFVGLYWKYKKDWW
jgi:hypothetical protein